VHGTHEAGLLSEAGLLRNQAAGAQLAYLLEQFVAEQTI
jgi:hypothetical protein